MGARTEGTETHTMHCMEIWGGNKAVRNAIATPGLDIWVYSEPYQADIHGGDVHYVTLCGGGIITRLIVADVSGHGESVAEFSHQLRRLMRRNINSKSQKRLVGALNRQFTELAQLQRFATAVVATYLATTDRLSVCNAAHPRPLIYRATQGRWSLLTHDFGESAAQAMNLPLGVDEDSTYDQFSVKLDPGDFVIFYTDALTEAMAPSGQMLGEQGLLTLVRGLELTQPDQLGPALLEGIHRHRDGGLADDDVTILVLHHNGGPPRRLSVGEKLDVYAKVFGLKSV
jgi:sigma-B regulation protein RsbU (phosphoserine phosphatase)